MSARPRHASSFSRAAFLLLALVLTAVACTRRSAATDQAPDVRVEIIDLRPDPPSVGEAVLEFRLTDRGGMALSGADLDLKADMTHAGMIPVFGDVVDEGDGVYRSTFEWSMAGDWILTVSGNLQDGRVIQRQLEVSVATDGG